MRIIAIIFAVLLLAGCASKQLIETAETPEQKYYAYKAAFAGILVPATLYNANPICTLDLLAAGVGCAREPVAQIFCQAGRDAHGSMEFGARILADYSTDESKQLDAATVGLAALGMMARGVMRANLYQATAKSIADYAGAPTMQIASRGFQLAFQLATGVIIARQEIQIHQTFVEAMVIEGRGPTKTEIDTLDADIDERLALVCAPFDVPTEAPAALPPAGNIPAIKETGRNLNGVLDGDPGAVIKANTPEWEDAARELVRSAARSLLR